MKAKPFSVYHYFGFQCVDKQQNAIGIIDYSMNVHGYIAPKYYLNLGSMSEPRWTIVSRDKYHEHIGVTMP